MTDTDAMTAQIAALLEKCGHSPEEAQRLAQTAARSALEAAPGAGFGNLAPQEIGTVWKRAARAGTRRLVVEITAEGHDQEDAEERGTVSVRVSDAEKWPGHTDHHTAERAATDALLGEWDDVEYLRNDPRAGWSEVDYMANGEECPDVFQPGQPFSVPESWNRAVQETAQDGPKTAEQWRQATARARAEEMN